MCQSSLSNNEVIIFKFLSPRASPDQSIRPRQKNARVVEIAKRVINGEYSSAWAASLDPETVRLGISHQGISYHVSKLRDAASAGGGDDDDKALEEAEAEATKEHGRVVAEALEQAAVLAAAARAQEVADASPTQIITLIST
jgi:hypothetical protein